MRIDKIKLYPVREGAELPQRESAYASGYDLKVYGDHEIESGETRVIPTGLALADVLPPGVDMQVRPRSSLALKHGLIVANAPGTIDGDYTGEIGVVVTRLFRPEHLVPVFDKLHVSDRFSVLVGWNREAPLTITHGTRIAQLVFNRLLTPFLEFTTPNSMREERLGFGSTGV